MAPSARKRTQTRKATVAHYRKQKVALVVQEQQQHPANIKVKRSRRKAALEEDEEDHLASTSSTITSSDGFDETVMDGSSSLPSTPKAERFRIPEIVTCPPAPKKQRLMTSSTNPSNCSVPIPFFAPPDLELFFLFALN